MWYVVLIVIALVAAILLMRLRVRLELSKTHRVLFVGLGRNGPEFDFGTKTGRIRLFGLYIKSFRLERPALKRDSSLSKVPPSVPRAAKPRRRKASIGEWLAVLPDSITAAWRFLVGILRSAIIEECDADLRAGFPSPDLTGQAYGYYCALVGAVPALAGRVSYVPDWTGVSFAGSVRIAVTLPLYALMYRTIALLFQLPLRKLYKLSRGKP